MTIDPLAEVVTLLQPMARFSKQVFAAGTWRIRRSNLGEPFYCVVIDGRCRVTLDGARPFVVQAGDFVLVPAAFGITMASLDASVDTPASTPVDQGDGSFRIGRQDGPAGLRIVAGHCTFGSSDAALLVSLLPRVVHVRGQRRLTTLVQLVGDESRQRRPARDVVLSRLLEVMLIEALRSTTATNASPGLVRGLADERLAVALRAMHEHSTRPWTVAGMAKEAALSRSVFFERFSRAMGVTPMEYLVAWRMARAKDLLRRHAGGVAEVAERVGYGSASAFSVAFTRHVGRPPSQFARDEAVAAGSSS